MYQVPPQYYFRLHHPRPRFKTEIENVLIYVATEIAKIGGPLPNADFKRKLNSAIRAYPGNLYRSQKTIDNWRTEIDALFGFIVDDGVNSTASKRAIELATDQDLVKFFKLFCYHFQYPGGFVKPHMNLEFLNAGINFKPVHYILKMLWEAEQQGVRAGISKAEATHCIFNDLRVTRDARSVNDTWTLIKNNRAKNVTYDIDGDVTRYAGDILDYAVQANLLVKRPNNMYYINHLEDIAIQRFLNPDPADHFDYYRRLPSRHSITLEEVTELDAEWVRYFNTPRDNSFFDTDILALIADTTEQYESLKAQIENLDDIIEEGMQDSGAGAIGSIGENLILKHERARIEMEGRPDLKHLIKRIPSMYAMGYDINSVEKDAKKRQIEVKTTASPRPVDFKRFHLTENEWNAANTYKESYYVYRLMVSKGSMKLRLIKDPVAQYKCGNLEISIRNGVDITIDPDKCGEEVDLLE